MGAWVTCFLSSGWKICGDLDDQFNLTCNKKEELTGGTEACGRYIIRVGAEPHVVERSVCVNVGGIKFPVFLELASHRVAARPWARLQLCRGCVWMRSRSCDLH